MKLHRNTTHIKLAHITLTMEPGGIENFIVNFAQKLNHSRFKLTVGCLDTGGPLLNQIHSLGFKSFVLNRKPGLDWRLVISLARIFSKEKFDIVHTHNEAAHFYGGLAAKLSGVPCLITTEHSRHYIDNAVKKRRLQKFLMSEITDRWVTVSEKLAQASIEKDGLASKKLMVIPNGIDIEKFARDYVEKEKLAELKQKTGLPENAKVIIMVARLDPIKNHSLLIQAVAKIKEQINNLHIIFVGDGELRGELTQLAQHLGLETSVHFLGYKEDIQKYLWLSDIFVLCSKTEGMPLSLLEALAASVPVIITKSANRAVLIKDDINGKVAENDLDSLASALTHTLKHPDYYRKISENGFDFIKKHFSLETMMNRYESLYEKILKEKCCE